MKKYPYSPWAICTASVGRKDKAKYERCVRAVKARMGMKNPSISAVWPAMKDRQRFAALRFSGIGEETAKYQAILDWSDLPSESKSALLRGWNMGEVGRTTRRYRDTTRRMPVLTNSGLTLKRWAAKQPYRMQKSGHVFSIPDGRLVDRSEAWHLSDYVVSSVVGGSLWFSRRRGRARARVNSGGWYVMSKYTSVAWYPTREEAVKVATQLNYRGGTIYTVVSDKKGIDWLKDRFRKNGTKGAYPFKDKEAQYRKLKMSELMYASEDAKKTAKIWDGHDQATANWYWDDFHTIQQEIQRRRKLVGAEEFFRNKVRRHFRNPIPSWLQTRGQFWQKFGFTPEEFELAIRRLPEDDKKLLHDKIGSEFSEDAVRWVMSRQKKRRSVGANSFDESRTPSKPYFPLVSSPNRKVIDGEKRAFAKHGIKSRVQFHSGDWYVFVQDKDRDRAMSISLSHSPEATPHQLRRKFYRRHKHRDLTDERRYRRYQKAEGRKQALGILRNR